MTQALYRRYRPETFADVIGQEHVTEPLMRALSTGRVGHAYLFSGPRGCGKTTSARILARCLNCREGPTPVPCGTCDSCVALARGGPGAVDVIEIDAASHGGVDDARDLRERASFGPAQSRFKVYIIDEAHMVTPQGFNALLKIVEEPPEHVKFVFATTEPEKVIGTIRSRTHHYPFRLVPPGQLTRYLEEVCASERVHVEPGVLSFVTRAGGGSVRDSLSVLDQLIAGSDEGGLTYERAASILGFTDAELLDGVVDAVGAGDAAATFVALERVIETGLDPRRFVEDLLERFRDLIVVNAVPEATSAVLRSVPSDELERMRVQASVFGAGALSRAADVVNTGLAEMTGAISPRLQLELLAARLLLPGAAGEAGYAARLDRLERRLDLGGASVGASEAPAPGPAPARRPAGGEVRGSARSPGPAETPESGPLPASAPDTPPDDAEAGPRGLDTAALRRAWPDVLARLFNQKRATWTLVSEHAQVLRFDGRRLVLGMATSGLTQAFRAGPHAEYVRQALIDVLGVDAIIETGDTGGPGSATTGGPRPIGVPGTHPGAEPAQPDPDVSKTTGTRKDSSPSPAQRSGGPSEVMRSTRSPGPAASAELGGGAAFGQVEAPDPWSKAHPVSTAPSWAGEPQIVADAPASPATPSAARPVDDSAASLDDEDIEELSDVGVPVVERILGGTIIRDEPS